MLDRLQVPAAAETGHPVAAEAVYQAMREHPSWHVAELVSHLGISETAINDALSTLADRALVQPSDSRPGALRAVSPHLGLLALLDRVQQHVEAQQFELQVARAMILAGAGGREAAPDGTTIVRLHGAENIRDRLNEYARTAAHSCLHVTAGRGLSRDAIELGKDLALLMMDRGVSVRSVYQESVLQDPDTREFASWLADQGEHSRVVVDVPLRMVIVDGTRAIIPADPRMSGRGALEIRGFGLVWAFCVLFDMMWDRGRPLDERFRVNEHGLTEPALTILRLLRRGRTDEAIGRQLGLSERTVRRTVAEIMKRLNAESRFQAGVEAAMRGWV